MSGRRARRSNQPPSPRVPTWVLALVTVVFITGSVALFVGDDDSAPRDSKPSSTEGSGSDESEGVLKLPKQGDEPTDSRKRGDAGKEGSGGDGRTTQSDAPAANADAGPELPPTAANLEGLTIAIVPASAGASTTEKQPDREFTIAGITTRCAPKVDAERLPIELALAGRLSALLDRARADPLRLDDAKRGLACVDTRLGLQERATFVLVVQADPKGTSRVLLPRTTRDSTATDRDTANALAGELAVALGLKGPVRATTAADKSLLTDTGAVDRPGGAAVVFVRIGVPEVTNAALDTIALNMLRALAATATVTRAGGDAGQSSPG